MAKSDWELDGRLVSADSIRNAPQTLIRPKARKETGQLMRPAAGDLLSNFARTATDNETENGTGPTVGMARMKVSRNVI